MTNINEIKTIASEAFAMQTVTIQPGKTIYLKKDVQEAFSSYNNFISSPSEDKFSLLLAAVKICVKRKRSGFYELSRELEKYSFLKFPG